MKYKTTCEGCLFLHQFEVLPGIDGTKCELGGLMIKGGIGSSLCPLNRLLLEIEKAMEGGSENG